jgi:glycosyltransferase involved in cell wall biosynthesis
VTFAVKYLDADPEPSRLWFEEQKAAGLFTDFFAVEVALPRGRRRFAKALLHPGWGAAVLRQAYLAASQTIREAIGKRRIDAVIVSTRFFFFLGDVLRPGPPLILDLGDCFTLYCARQTKLFWQTGEWGKFVRSLRPVAEEFLQERYYARQFDRSVMVSPVDKEALDRMTGRPEKSTVILNGVRMRAASSRPPKIPHRLIFTGNMNFPPNYEGTLWFLDHVFPRVLREVPEATFVIVGANPVEALLSRQNDQVKVTGFAQDLGHEIAISSLYVAPLITGSGFKNKVAEALVQGTYVIGTPMAAEFLEPEIRQRLCITSDAGAMAQAVIEYLRDPAAHQDEVEYLRQHILHSFTWEQRARELAAVLAGK